MSDVVVDAPAKVNLFLRILAREADGYHGVETLFCGVELSDRLRVRRRARAGVELSVDGPWDLGPAEDNLAVRAARAFLDRADVERTGVELRLEKRIPPGAGLGGGSSDAASVLRGMNRLFARPLRERELVRIGARLGSDVPFFLSPSPLALAWSRGHRMLALPPLPIAPVLLVSPGTPTSTPDAYRRLARSREERGDPGHPDPWIGTPDDLGSWRGVSELAVNDFEGVVLDGRPALRETLAELRRAGPGPALLCGSGSSVFAVFRSADDAERCRDGLGRGPSGFDFRLTRTLAEWPAPRVEPS